MHDATSDRACNTFFIRRWLLRSLRVSGTPLSQSDTVRVAGHMSAKKLVPLEKWILDIFNIIEGDIVVGKT
jgi:hypothetical protein